MRGRAISARAPRARKYPACVYTLASPPPLSLLPPLPRPPRPLLFCLVLPPPPRRLLPRHRTRTRTRTRTPRPALTSPLLHALASAPRLLRRALVRARFVAVFSYRGCGCGCCCCCCCCFCCCNRIGSCAIPGIEFREWCNHTSGLDSSLAASSLSPALASCTITQPLLLLLLLLRHSCDGCCLWG